MNLFYKMIIGCNPKIMDFITHGLQHYVIGVKMDPRMSGVNKDSKHGT